jgi:predicted secreted protein
MGWFTGVAVYILIWWVSLFAVLPLWVKPSDPEDPGYGAGAPQRPLLWRKLALTSGIAAVIWVGVFVLVHEPWFSFRGP